MPEPMNASSVVVSSHGGGGARTKQLLNSFILKHFGNPLLDRLDDSAVLSVPETELALTTDSYVVDPVFFPGGDIGRLAVCGTVNDLAMQAARPLFFSVGLILEEGLPLDRLDRILKSMAGVLRENEIHVVTGDTKVVGNRREGGGIYINTTGLGKRLPGADTHISNARPGDAVILSGTMGDHGIAVICHREGLRLETGLVSDVAPLWDMTRRLLERCPAVRALRDPTRGGVAAALCDIAEASGTGIRIQERALPVKKEVRGACQLLGFDPLNVANEGKALAVCPENEAGTALAALRGHSLGGDAAVIGQVVEEHACMVVMETAAGGERIIETPGGEDFPRIC